VDVVYISTPHTFHAANTLLCLDAGKAVLCEKPFAINADEAENVIRHARERDLFLMEAMWTRYLPVVVQVRKWLADGMIGEVRMLLADFGFRAGFQPESRLFDPRLGGGGLLDVGIYTVAMAFMVFGGPPSRITGMADIGKTGVDEQAAILFGYDGGQLAALTCAVRTSTPHEATIIGTEGRIRIETPFWDAHAATLTLSGKEPVRVEPPRIGNGYNYEAEEVGRCLRAGLRESAVMPLDETLTIMKTLDAIRAQWGMKYPMET
jgi:predicted dehydrogenase